MSYISTFDGERQPPSSPTSTSAPLDSLWDPEQLAPGQCSSDYKPSDVSPSKVPRTVTFASAFPVYPEVEIPWRDPEIGGVPLTPGICGLENIGNTCYFNSALQCVMSVPQLCHFFLAEDGGYRPLCEAAQCNESQNNESQNDEFPAVDETELPSSQPAAEDNSPSKNSSTVTLHLCKLITKVWSGTCSELNPAGLHSSIGKVHTQFKNFLQHDSQELLMFLLSGLHEDIQHQTSGVAKRLKHGRETKSVAEPTQASTVGVESRYSPSVAAAAGGGGGGGQLSSRTGAGEACIASGSHPLTGTVAADGVAMTSGGDGDDGQVVDGGMRARHRTSPDGDVQDLLPSKVACIREGDSLPDFCMATAVTDAALAAAAAAAAHDPDPSGVELLVQGRGLRVVQLSDDAMATSAAATAASAEVYDCDVLNASPARSLPPEEYDFFCAEDGDGDGGSCAEDSMAAMDCSTSLPYSEDSCKVEAACVVDTGKSTVVSDTFQGEFRSQITCCKCQRSSSRREPFLCLSVPLPGATIKQFSFIWVPFRRLRRRFLLSLHKRSTLGDVKKILCERLAADPEEAYEVDVLRLVVGNVRSGNIRTTFDNEHQICNLPSSHYLHIFELNPQAADLSAASVDPSAVIPLIPGNQLSPSSSLWNFPLETEVVKKSFAVSDTDSGFTQSSGSSTADIERNDGVYYSSSATHSVAESCLSVGDVPALPVSAAHSTLSAERHNSGPNEGSQHTLPHYTASRPLSRVHESGTATVGQLPATSISSDTLPSPGDWHGISSGSTLSMSSRHTPLHMSDSGVASRNSELSGEMGGSSLPESSAVAGVGGTLHSGLAAYLESSPYRTTQSMASPQSTVSSDDSLTCRSEISCDSLSSTSHAFATKLPGNVSDTVDAAEQATRFSPQLSLEEEPVVVSVSGMVPASVAEQPLPPYMDVVPDAPTVPGLAIGAYGVDMQAQAHPGAHTDPAELDVQLASFFADDDFPSLVIEGCGIPTSAEVALPLEPVSSDNTLSDVVEVLASDHDDPDQLVGPPISSDLLSSTEPSSLDQPFPNVAASSECFFSDMRKCPICLEDRPIDTLMLHRGCTAVICTDCISNMLASGSSYPCSECREVVDVTLSYVPLAQNEYATAHSLQLKVVTRHRTNIDNSSFNQFSLIGVPYMVNVSSHCDTSKLYDMVAENLASDCSLPMSPGSSHVLSATALGSRNAIHSGHFVISTLDALTYNCNRCACCLGCVLPRRGVVELRHSDMLAVTFGIPLDRRCIDVLEYVGDDASMLDLEESDFIPLSRCLEDFTKVEFLGGSDPFDCPHCESKEEAVKSIAISHLPPVLLLQLKRFTCDGAFGEKLDNAVRFALTDVDFSGLLYCGGDAESVASDRGGGSAVSGGDGTCELAAECDDTAVRMEDDAPPGVASGEVAGGNAAGDGEDTEDGVDGVDDTSSSVYDVTGFICHSGGLGAGHYTAFVRHPVNRQWYYCNDRMVTQRMPTSEDMDRAYVLVYSRKGGSAVTVPRPEWSLELKGVESPPCVAADVPPPPAPGMEADSTFGMMSTIGQIDHNTTRDLIKVASRLQQEQHQANRAELLSTGHTPSPTVSPLNGDSPTHATVDLTSYDYEPGSTLTDSIPAPTSADGSLRELAQGQPATSPDTSLRFLPDMTEDEQVAMAVKMSLEDHESKNRPSPTASLNTGWPAEYGFDNPQTDVQRDLLGTWPNITLGPWAPSADPISAWSNDSVVVSSTASVPSAPQQRSSPQARHVSIGGTEVIGISCARSHPVAGRVSPVGAAVDSRSPAVTMVKCMYCEDFCVDVDSHLFECQTYQQFCVPVDNEVVHAEQEFCVPADNEVMPADNEVMPADNEVMPADNEVVHAEQDSFVSGSWRGGGVLAEPVPQVIVGPYQAGLYMEMRNMTAEAVSPSSHDGDAGCSDDSANHDGSDGGDGGDEHNGTGGNVAGTTSSSSSAATATTTTSTTSPAHVAGVGVQDTALQSSGATGQDSAGSEADIDVGV